MARTDSAKMRMDRWRRELGVAEKVYQDWATDYGVDRLEGFVVKSRQIRDTKMQLDPYIVNQLLPSLDARLPALMFDTPHVIVTPQQAKVDDAGSTAEQKAQLREDLLNTIIQDPKSGFSSETEMALREAFFRFGVVEVFYTAQTESLRDIAQQVAEDQADQQSDPNELPNPDDITAPTPPGPPLGPTGQPVPPSTGLPPIPKPENVPGPAPSTTVEPPSEPDAVKLTRRVPKQGTERIKFRRIPAKTVRISGNNTNDTEKCDWIAYYEWKYIDDVKANPNYQNRNALKANYSMSEQVLRTVDDTSGERDKPPADGMVKIWKLWSIREKKRYVWCDGEDKFLVDGKAYKYLPMSALRFVKVLDEWYPVPVSFNWTGPQIEYNETRDMQRTHRKRALRKFVYLASAFEDDEELAKLSSADDMAFAKVNATIGAAANAISPVGMAPMDPIHQAEIALVRQEIFETTRVGGEARSVAESKTARQASIIAVNKQVQDTKDRQTVSSWLTDICWIALRCAEENITFGTLIKSTVDLTGQAPQQEAAKQQATWQMIQMDDLGDLEYEVKIDVESLAPMSSTLQAQQWQGVIQLLSNPVVMAIVSRSEVLARRFFSTMKITDEQDIQEIMRVARELTAPVGMPGAVPPGTPGAPTPNGGGDGGMGGGLEQILGALTGGMGGE